MNFARFAHTASILSTGKVLVAGGYSSSSYLNSAELYDPSTGVWTQTGSMSFTRAVFTASILSNGNVLVAGGYGYDGGGSWLNSAELYNLSTGVWTQTGSMIFTRSGHTASILSNGNVLVTGGQNDFVESGYLNSAELYDPSTGVWTRTNNMNVARFQHTASILSNGNVLVTGGMSYISYGGCLDSAELYDPSTGVWTQTNSMSFTRYSHTASVMSTGKVLVAGGYTYRGSGGPSNSAELYDPSTGVWTQIGSMSFTRYLHTASILSTGNVLVAGGGIYDGYLNSAELYS